MRVVPRDNTGAVTFYEVHAPVWQAEAASIGLTPEDAAAVADAAAAARDAFNQQYAAQQAARAATQAYENAVARLRAAGAACIAKVRVAATAAGEGGNGVYERAQLPMPASPGRLPAPGRPTNFATRLNADGALELTWACDNPSGTAGTVYEIRRRDVAATGESGPLTFVAVAGSKSFLDATVPPGTAVAEYQVTAIRSTRRGSPGRYRVTFAAGGTAAPVLGRAAA